MPEDAADRALSGDVSQMCAAGCEEGARSPDSRGRMFGNVESLLGASVPDLAHTVDLVGLPLRSSILRRSKFSHPARSDGGQGAPARS